jgi:hypothetical protein
MTDCCGDLQLNTLATSSSVKLLTSVMSDNNPLIFDEAGFEPRDIAPVTIPALLAILGILGVLAIFVISGLYRFLDERERALQKPVTPLVNAQGDMRSVLAGDLKKFPEPRLETNERNEYSNFRMQEERRLHTYGWIDQSSGVMHIPIDRAMQLLVQRQLPTTPRVGSVPPSPVNLARKAAEAADHALIGNPQTAGTNPARGRRHVQ